MISQKQLEANKRNALKGTGPRTPEGKAIVARNPIKHGLLSRLDVLPGFENREDWERHMEETVASLAPEGYIEEELAERVALVLWRLGRTARYEREAMATGLENAESDMAHDEMTHAFSNDKRKWPFTVAVAWLRRCREMLDILGQLIELPDQKELAEGRSILWRAAEIAKVDLYKGDSHVALSDWPENVDLENVRWTAMTILRSLRTIAKAGGITFDSLLEAMTNDARADLDWAEQEYNRLVGLLSQYRRARLLPGDAESEKVRRYEAHLERSLYKALHELQRLQAARRGVPTPLPLALDVNVSSAGSDN